ncbi:MAG: AAA-like domain-containing protein [Anaerolineales bacterium]
MGKQSDYIDLNIRIYKQGEQFAAHLASPAGDYTTTFTLPFSEFELKYYLKTLGHSRAAVRSVGAPEIGEIKIFGDKLFDTLFQDEMRELLGRNLARAYRQNQGVRIRLNMQAAPSLAQLPWEHLYSNSQNRFFSLSPNTPIVRFYDLPEPVRPFAVAPPLRILLMVSNPQEHPPLDVSREVENMQRALANLIQAGLVELDVMKTATLMDLRRQLRQRNRPYHVFHFIGHGNFHEAAQNGVLVLADHDNHAFNVAGEDLATYLHPHRSLRLVLINSCQGGRTGLDDPFTGVAGSLLQQGIPGVVAMQFPITDQAAIAFSEEFYRAIAEGWALDAAVAEGRLAIKAISPVEWGTPVLYTRASDGVVFDIAQPPQETETPPPRLHDGKPVSDEDTFILPPLPNYDPRPSLETPTGVVRADSPFYIERHGDEQLRRQILSLGTTTTIRAGRQAGKTSLLIRGVQIAKEEHYPVIYLDFQLIESTQLESLGSLLHYLAREIAYQLDIDPETVDKVWRSPRGAPDKFNQFLRARVLRRAKMPILLAIDEADRLLDTPYKQDFFALLRSWDSRRAFDDVWRKLNLAIVISTYPYVLIDDINQSPFNVGLTIVLEDFSQEQVTDLNERHGSPVSPADISPLMELVGGHPYLVRQALYTLVDKNWTLLQLLKDAADNHGPFGKHLRFHRDNLKQRPELLDAMRQTIRGKQADETLLDRLVAAGVVKETDDGYVPRCGLYTIYFRGRL